MGVVSSVSKVQAGTNADIGFGSLLKVEPKAKNAIIDLLFLSSCFKATT